MKNETIKLWAFYYNCMIEESVSSIISYHRTKKGATDAMEKHKSELKSEFDEMYPDESGWSPKFGRFEAWFVEEFELIIED